MTTTLSWECATIPLSPSHRGPCDVRSRDQRGHCRGHPVCPRAAAAAGTGIFLQSAKSAIEPGCMTQPRGQPAYRRRTHADGRSHTHTRGKGRVWWDGQGRWKRSMPLACCLRVRAVTLCALIRGCGSLNHPGDLWMSELGNQVWVNLMDFQEYPR